MTLSEVIITDGGHVHGLVSLWEVPVVGAVHVK